MDWLLVVLVLLFILAGVMSVGLTIVALFGAPSMFMRDFGRQRGPESLWLSGLFACLALSVLGAFFGFLAGMMIDLQFRLYDNTNIWLGAVAGAGSYFAVEAIIAAFSAKGIAKGIRLQKQIAPAVAEYAMKRFASIIDVGSGVIKVQDLTDDSANSELLDQLRLYHSEIGHVIDSYTTTSFIMAGKVMVPTTVTHYVYGVSKEDLLSYPGRVASDYSRW